MGLFFGNWSDENGLIQDFEIEAAVFDNYHVLLAAYEYISYDGNAYVLLLNKHDNKLYEVHGSHCSCYGLEGQWEPEETSAASIIYRIKFGNLGTVGADDFSEQLSLIANIYDNEVYDYIVFAYALPERYFASGSIINYLPDNPGLVNSTYTALETSTMIKYVVSSFSAQEDGKFGAAFVINPDLYEWQAEGTNHREEVLQQVDGFNSRIRVTREIEKPCKRVGKKIKTNLLAWMEEHLASFERAKRYDVVNESQVIVIRG